MSTEIRQRIAAGAPELGGIWSCFGDAASPSPKCGGVGAYIFIQNTGIDVITERYLLLHSAGRRAAPLAASLNSHRFADECQMLTPK
jgi:hypothetical protein